MKGYRPYIIAFVAVLALYIVAEMNRPKKLDWKMTLSKDDKNPFGAYILYHQLKDIFPHATVSSYRLPVYNQVNNFHDSNTAYLLINRDLPLTKEDVNEMLDYVIDGNYVFIAASSFSRSLMDTLKFATRRRLDLVKGDSVTINFRNPELKAKTNYGFKRMTLDAYVSRLDTASAVALGENQLKDINFFRMQYGSGAIFVHALPLCFSNYFLLTEKNAEYAAKALSCLPPTVTRIFWDEYYKLGPSGSSNPLRFILNDPYLRWAFRIGLAGMLLFVLFGMKRKQRVIPVINPLRNTTLDFVQTVGNVYFNQRNNKDIAVKKTNFFLEHIRSVFYLPTNNTNEAFANALSKKTGFDEKEAGLLVDLINNVQNSEAVDDKTLLDLNKKIDAFYSTVKINSVNS